MLVEEYFREQMSVHRPNDDGQVFLFYILYTNTLPTDGFDRGTLVEVKKVEASQLHTLQDIKFMRMQDRLPVFNQETMMSV